MIKLGRLFYDTPVSWIIQGNMQFISNKTPRQLLKESRTGISTYDVYVDYMAGDGNTHGKVVKCQSNNTAKIMYRPPVDSDWIKSGAPSILEEAWTLDLREDK